MTDGAMTAAASVADDVRVARVHLRLGPAHARSRGARGPAASGRAWTRQAMAALAEARWRTGDAAAAAAAALATSRPAARTTSRCASPPRRPPSEGRATEARDLMDRLPASDAATLDALFAGMPRRAFWPAGPVDRSDLDELRRGATSAAPAIRRGRVRSRPRPARRAAPSAACGARPATAWDRRKTRSVPGPRAVLEATSGPEWGAAPPAPPGQLELPPAARMPVDMPLHQGRRLKGQLDPQEEIVRARDELDSRPERAFLRLALVLRHDPTFAPRCSSSCACAASPLPRSFAATPSACWADISKPRPPSMRPRRAWRSRDRAHPRPRQARRRAAPARRPHPRALRGAGAEARRPEADDGRSSPGRAALRRPPREAVLQGPRRLHHERPAGRGRARGPERDLDRPRDERRDAAARGRARLDPRRLRGRDGAEPRPRVRQPRDRRVGARAVVRPGRARRRTGARSIAGCSPRRTDRRRQPPAPPTAVSNAITASRTTPKAASAARFARSSVGRRGSRSRSSPPTSPPPARRSSAADPTVPPPPPA